jgi:hypothetical protein
LVGAAPVVAMGPTTATIVGASVSTMVITVLLGVGVGMGYRWYEKKRRPSSAGQ